ncbi:MAG TPA: FAD-dependent monooxygenase [Kineosporiaceae bacterium]|nr:FAD-dependent monooxygenase [Kineosporiaceae bacterium]
MRIACVGGGPAGLYTAISAKLRDRSTDVVVLERNPAGVTQGWGVVFWDDLLDALHRNDPPSARTIRDAAAVWDGQLLRVGDRPPVFLGGSGYAVGRHALLSLLSARAAELGVEVLFDTPAEGHPAVAAADLVVAADGAGSRLRSERSDAFGTQVDVGRNKYIWLGTTRLFSTFTFGFVDTGVGWICCHAYRYDDTTSTFIVECPTPTWEGLGFDRMDTDSCLRTLEKHFALHLQGHPLLAQRAGSGPASWLNFRRVTNRSWSDGNLALAGDAAHTTHFAIGSGTKLAMLDAIALADHVLADHDLPRALRAYEAERQAALAPLQEEAMRSTEWFENAVGALPGDDDVQLGWSLWQRRSGSPTWRYYLHLATQNASVRRLRVLAGTMRRGVREQRRELVAARRRAARGTPAR